MAAASSPVPMLIPFFKHSLEAILGLKESSGRLRVEDVPQPVTDQVDGEHGDGQAQRRPEGVHRVPAPGSAGDADDLAPEESAA